MWMSQVVLPNVIERLTRWWHEFVSSAMAPARWVNVCTVIIHPEVVSIWPAIKMYQQLARPDVDDGCNTDQHRIALVNDFQFHADFEAMRCMLHTEQQEWCMVPRAGMIRGPPYNQEYAHNDHNNNNHICIVSFVKLQWCFRRVNQMA